MHALPKHKPQTTSLATTIPPELLTKIVHFVGHEALLSSSSSSSSSSDEPNPSALYFTDRKGGMRHLSACSLTCVYWAKITRRRMFRIIVIRSITDINDLLDFFKTQTPNHHSHARGIPPILYCLQHLIVEHRLGDWVWFHHVRRLLKSQILHHPYTNLRLDVHVSSPTLPGQDSLSQNTATYFPAARHPLFRCMPRPLPIPQLSYKSMRLVVKDVRFGGVLGLKNLVRDFNLRSAEWYDSMEKGKGEGEGEDGDGEWRLDRPWRWSTDRVYCHNVHWNVDSQSPTTTITIAPGSPLVSTQSLSEGVSYVDITTTIVGADEVEMDGPSVVASGCTDNVVGALDCLVAVLGSHNRRIPSVKMEMENWEVVMGLVRVFREGEGDVRVEGSWCYRTGLLLFELELDFIFSKMRTPTLSVGQREVPLVVESIRFNTTSQDLLGREQVADRG